MLASILFCFAVGCKKGSEPIECIYSPFSSEVKMTVDDSEYILFVEKGGANLVSVSVVSPEALRGLRISLGEKDTLSFTDKSFLLGLNESVGKLIYSAFSQSNTLETNIGEEITSIVFSYGEKRGVIYADSFTKTPLTLKIGNIDMEFNEFIR